MSQYLRSSFFRFPFLRSASSYLWEIGNYSRSRSTTMATMTTTNQVTGERYHFHEPSMPFSYIIVIIMNAHDEQQSGLCFHTNRKRERKKTNDIWSLLAVTMAFQCCSSSFSQRIQRKEQLPVVVSSHSVLFGGKSIARLSTSDFLVFIGLA